MASENGLELLTSDDFDHDSMLGIANPQNWQFSSEAHLVLPDPPPRSLS
jgi:hypothetical protein